MGLSDLFCKFNNNVPRKKKYKIELTGEGRSFIVNGASEFYLVLVYFI